MPLFEENMLFNFAKLLKSCKENKTPEKKIFFFENDKDLCVIHTLKIYLKRLQEWRSEKETTYVWKKIISIIVFQFLLCQDG